jgi:penicillin-binding protein 2
MYDMMVTPAEIKGIDTLDFCRMMNIDTAEFNRRILDANLKTLQFALPFLKTCLLPKCR